jgi:hypothetical protein
MRQHRGHIDDGAGAVGRMRFTASRIMNKCPGTLTPNSCSRIEGRIIEACVGIAALTTTSVPEGGNRGGYRAGRTLRREDHLHHFDAPRV